MQSEEVTRERQLNIRLSEDELRRLEGLAKHYGLNIASVIRMLVKRDVDALRLASFVDDTGARTGLSKATVYDGLFVAENLTEEVKDAIRGTPLANAARELVALAKLPPAEQMPAVKAMKLKAMKAEHRAATKKVAKRGP